jgi:hypothetical protein
MPLRFRCGLLLAFALVMLASVQPASAIQYGAPDDGAHPYVGGLVFNVGGQEFVGCSGTMISPTVLLTASHCYPDEVWVLVGITFAGQFTPGSYVPVTSGDFSGNPAWFENPIAANDVAVVVLPGDPGVGNASLPEIGLLDTMAPRAQPGNQERYLTSVGYGTTGLNRGAGGPPEFIYPEIRMRGEARIIGLNGNQLGGMLVQTTAAPGTGGGTCYGDSGGPFFVQGTDTIVATTITGTNKNCGGADINLRIDTQSIQEFLAQFL